MCYNSTQLAEKIYKDAVRLGASEEELNELLKKIEKAREIESYHKAGYDHPELHAFSLQNGKLDLKFHYWGLIPQWVRSREEAAEIWNRTLNARGETIFDKPAYKDAALTSRCIIPMDGYFEHHHKFKKTFPYYIFPKSEDRFFVAGITSLWTNPQSGKTVSTVAVVTSTATEMLAQIHNNPAMKQARMPLILNDSEALIWLKSNDQQVLNELIKPNTAIEMEAYTVGALSGKKYAGNDKSIIDEKPYPELDEPMTLF